MDVGIILPVLDKGWQKKILFEKIKYKDRSKTEVGIEFDININMSTQSETYLAEILN